MTIRAGLEGVGIPGAYVSGGIGAAAFLGLCIIWIVFPRSNGLTPGAWVEGHYMMPLGETVTRVQLPKTRQMHRKWAKGLT